MKENYRCCNSFSVVGLKLARFLHFRFGNIFNLKNPSGNPPQTLNFVKENYRCCNSFSVVGLKLARFLHFRFGNIFILKNPSGNPPQTLNFNPAIFWQMDFSAGFAIRRGKKNNLAGFRIPNPSRWQKWNQNLPFFLAKI